MIPFATEEVTGGTHWHTQASHLIFSQIHDRLKVPCRCMAYPQLPSSSKSSNIYKLDIFKLKLYDLVHLTKYLALVFADLLESTANNPVD